MSRKLKIFILFGDGGRYAGRVSRCPTHEIHFWKYFFDDYMSVDESGSRYNVDRDRIAETVAEIYSGKYDAASCDGNDALLLQFYADARGLDPIPFIINEVDRFEMARWVDAFIQHHYKRNFFDEFIAAETNNWMYIVSGRTEYYGSLGIKASNLFYLPMCTSSIEFTFPDFFGSPARGAGASAVPDGALLAVGSHNRDYATLVDAVRGTDFEVHVVTNLEKNPEIESPNVTWHDSLPEPEFLRALGGARAVVVPLRDNSRASGQMACAIPMKLGKTVIAAETESTRDLIIHGETGFLYRPGSAAGLKESLAAALDVPGATETVGARAAVKEAELSRIADRNLERLLKRIKSG